MLKLKKMKIEDISLLLDWFKQDHIREFWFSILNLSDTEIEKKYRKRLEEGVIDTYMIVKNNRKIGLIQTYFVENLEKYRISGKSKAIDLFIGEKNELGKGVGPEIIKMLIKDKIFSNSEIEYVCIDPEVKNERAIAAYKKVGFKHVNTELDEHSNLMTYYMVLNRNTIKK